MRRWSQYDFLPSGVVKSALASAAPASPRARHVSQSSTKLEASLGGSTHNKDGVFTGNRADDLRPSLGVDRLRDRLCPARKRVQHEELAHPIDVIEKLR